MAGFYTNLTGGPLVVSITFHTRLEKQLSLNEHAI